MNLTPAHKKLIAKAAILLSNRKRWTQYALARNAEGQEVPVQSARAVCWCADGALYKVGGPALCALVAHETHRRGQHPLSLVNDYEGFDAVVTRLWELAR